MSAVPAPMLAHSYPERRAGVAFPCVVQPKLDGVRLMVHADAETGALRSCSRTGKPLGGRDDAFVRLFADPRAVPRGCTLDGELYVHGARFQQIVSAARRPDDEAATAALRLEYHVYDVVAPGGYDQRRRVVEAVVAADRAAGGARIVAVPSETCAGPADVDAALRRWLERGYEGVMVRDPRAPYEPGKRSASLLKYKPFDDAEFPIVGFVEAGGKDRGTVVFECCAGPDGTTFHVRPEGSREERARLLREAPDLVRRRALLTVRFQGRTDAGVPRFPVGVAVRDYEVGPGEGGPLRIATWNVNGLAKAARTGGLLPLLPELDVLCLQELKCGADRADALLSAAGLADGWHVEHCCSVARKGYSGVAVASRCAPSQVARGMPGCDEAEAEGRVLSLHLDAARVSVVCAYAPNSGVGTLARLRFRTERWEPAFLAHVRAFGAEAAARGNALVVCGDLNVAADDLDVHHPERHGRAAGFTPQERAAFRALLAGAGLQDAYRRLYPDRVAYTFWSALGRGRERDAGWRLDYFLAPPAVAARVREVEVLQHHLGSDHAPVRLTLGDDQQQAVVAAPALGSSTTSRQPTAKAPCDADATRGCARIVLRAHHIREHDKGSTYGALAYQRVLEQVRRDDVVCDDDAGCTLRVADLSGVGPKISEALRLGRAGLPPGAYAEAASVEALLEVPWIGLRHALALVRQHGVRDGLRELLALPADARAALLSPQQRVGLAYASDLATPIPRAEMLRHRRKIAAVLHAAFGDDDAGVPRWELAGSFRRGAAQSGDVDVVLSSRGKRLVLGAVVAALRAARYLVADLASGPQKYLGICRATPDAPARRIDLLWCAPDAHAFGLLYMTGPRSFSIQLRREAKARGLTLSEHGLVDASTGRAVAADLRDERAIVDYLGLKYAPPTKRG